MLIISTAGQIRMFTEVDYKNKYYGVLQETQKLD